MPSRYRPVISKATTMVILATYLSTDYSYLDIAIPEDH